MPPRLRPRALPSCQHASTASAQSISSRPQHRLALIAASPASNSACSAQARCFSSSPVHSTRLRRHMWAWLNGPGQVFKSPLPNSTNYLGAYDREGRLKRAVGGKFGDKKDGDKNGALDPEMKDPGEAANKGDEGEDGAIRKSAKDGELPPEGRFDLKPFPLNDHFRSQSVLSEELRELIYKRVVTKGERIVSVSAQLGVALERVAAVVRLKEVELAWVAKGNTLALPYAKAVMEMLPTTPAPEIDPATGRPDRKIHESINDLPVHPSTRQQMFYPVPESRHFTREDAAKAFNPKLLSPDKRIPHPELILMEKARMAGLSRSQISNEVEKFVAAEDEKRKAIKMREERAKARHSKVVEGRRWDFVFQDNKVDDAGQDGRGRRAAGWRYGMPHEDRKSGVVKIPTKVTV